MSHWQGLLANFLWILGLSAILATLSWRLYATNLLSQPPKRRSKRLFLCLLLVSFLSVTLGLGLRPVQTGWKVLIWFSISLALAYQAWVSCQRDTGNATSDDHE